MKLSIAICDDEQKQTDYLKITVAEWARINRHLCDIRTFPSAEAFLFYYGGDKSADILLLDIEMGNINGIELAKRVRADNSAVQIIFVTGYQEYIADGYEVEALQYILKPVDTEKLCSTLDRALVKLKKNEKTLLLTLTEGTVRIPLHEIRYIEAQKNYVIVRTGEDITVRSTLSGIEKELDEVFFKTGRSFIIYKYKEHSALYICNKHDLRR